ncbi:MAG: hypothetical protein F6K09_32280, partial [Merismopedia sp. SIO2A8]|nr:hypothetical protein [Merismopedia sp. SIO2A8]
MPVIVMTVNQVEQHPNADSLRVYQMSAPACDTIQIIANLEHTYSVGDRVVVALADSILKDGTKIKPTKLRGLSSFGMTLGSLSVTGNTTIRSGIWGTSNNVTFMPY